MPQPNKGSAGKPFVSQPIEDSKRPSSSGPGEVMFGAPGGAGTKGK